MHYQQTLTSLNLRFKVLKGHMDAAISDGKEFGEVKSIYLQVREISSLIKEVISARAAYATVTAN